MSDRNSNETTTTTPPTGTDAVHGGEPRQRFGDAITHAISATATYVFDDTAELSDHFEHRIEREEYGRYGNATAIRPSASPNENSPRSTAPRTPCVSPAAWPPSPPRSSPCSAAVITSS